MLTYTMYYHEDFFLSGSFSDSEPGDLESEKLPVLGCYGKSFRAVFSKWLRNLK